MDPDEPSNWLNSFICVRKPNGKIRLCLYLTQLNKYSVRPGHNACFLDALLLRLAEARYFMIINCTSSFFILKLTYNSSLLTAFGMIFGKYLNV